MKLVNDKIPTQGKTPIERARRLGEEGEKAAGIVGHKKKIVSLSGTANGRYTDEVTKDFIREVKNVKYLTDTPQLNDYLLHSKAHNIPFYLQTRPTTIFSRGLQKHITNGDIINTFIP